MICADGAERAAVRKPPRSSLATSAMAPGFCAITMVVFPLVPTSRSMSKYCVSHHPVVSVYRQPRATEKCRTHDAGTGQKRT